MTASNEPRMAGGVADSPVIRYQTAVRCTSCGHVTIPALRCGNPDCRHLAEFHDMPKGKTTRKACSVSEGPKATRCGCRLFIPELPESETSQ